MTIGTSEFDVFLLLLTAEACCITVLYQKLDAVLHALINCHR